MPDPLEKIVFHFDSFAADKYLSEEAAKRFRDKALELLEKVVKDQYPEVSVEFDLEVGLGSTPPGNIYTGISVQPNNPLLLRSAQKLINEHIGEIHRELQGFMQELVSEGGVGVLSLFDDKG